MRKAKAPEKCPDCGKHALTLDRVTSRVFAHWTCGACGLGFTTDAASGRLTTRDLKRIPEADLTVRHPEGF